LTDLPRVEDEAMRVLQAASDKTIVLKLIGGVAIAMRCPSSRRDGLRRSYADMDLVGREKQSRKISEFFLEMDYKPRERFNALMGRKRLIFNDLVNQRRVDVFLDVFEMSHKFDFSDRVRLEPLTLPLADLLATKLQIVQTNDKDFRDMTTIFLDHDVGTGDGDRINGDYIARLCSNDWGIYKTFTTNLSRLPDSMEGYGLGPAETDTVKGRVTKLVERIEREPKTLAWKLRARVGEKMPWYELPEADKPVVTGSFD
jgi:hypothetical protein